MANRIPYDAVRHPPMFPHGTRVLHEVSGRTGTVIHADPWPDWTIEYLVNVDGETDPVQWPSRAVVALQPCPGCGSRFPAVRLPSSAPEPCSHRWHTTPR